MHFTIAKKMATMGVAVFIGLLAMGLIINRIDNNVNKALIINELRAHELEKVSKAYEAEQKLLLTAMDSIVDKESGKIGAERRQIIDEASKAISNNLNTLAELADTTNDKQRIQKLKEKSDLLISGITGDLFTLIEEKIPAGTASEADFAHIDDVIDGYGTAIETSFREIQTTLSAEARDADEALRATLSSMTITGYTVFAIVIAILAPVFFFFARGIVAPLRSTVSMLTELSHGHINQRLNLKRSDEIGQMADAMDSFADSLQQDIVKPLQQLADGDLRFKVSPYDDQDLLRNAIQKVSTDLNNIIDQIQNAGEQINTASGQVADSSQSLSQGATETAASLEEISSSMSEMTSQISLTAENANQANQLATDASKAAEDGNQQMKGMINAMAEIDEAGQNISKIIKVIDEIAFQTNLLALNAAVEAARAGQHGKGFAVVAEEVRNLAARSAKAAAETSELIEGSVEKTRNGNLIAEQTSTALGGIVGSITKVTDLVAEIAAASSEQAQGISQVNIGLGQIDQAVQQSTATAEESAAAAEELSSQAEHMKHMLSRFTLVNSQNIQFTAPQLSAPAATATPTVAPAASGWGESPRVKPQAHIQLDDDEFGKF